MSVGGNKALFYFSSDGECVEQLRVRFIVEPIFSPAYDCTGVKIVVWQLRLAGVYLD
jgi:hypothetical protein